MRKLEKLRSLNETQQGIYMWILNMPFKEIYIIVLIWISWNNGERVFHSRRGIRKFYFLCVPWRFKRIWLSILTRETCSSFLSFSKFFREYRLYGSRSIDFLEHPVCEKAEVAAGSWRNARRGKHKGPRKGNHFSGVWETRGRNLEANPLPGHGGGTCLLFVPWQIYVTLFENVARGVNAVCLANCAAKKFAKRRKQGELFAGAGRVVPHFATGSEPRTNASSITSAMTVLVYMIIFSDSLIFDLSSIYLLLRQILLTILAQYFLDLFSRSIELLFNRIT